MRTSLKFLTLFLTLSSTGLMAANHWVALKAPNVLVRSQIAEFIHIDSIVDDHVYAVVGEASFKQLKERFASRIIETYPIELAPLKKGVKASANFPIDDDIYHTYEEMESLLKDLVQRYPGLCELKVIGQSLSKRNLYALEVHNKDSAALGAFIPTVAYLGAHHAREHLSTEVPLLAAKKILEEYQTSARVRQIVDHRRLIFIPMVNPDGVTYDIRDGRYHMWRKNHLDGSGASEGVDLNRNYDQNWARGGSSSYPPSDTFHGPGPFSEPETQAIKKFVEDRPELRGMISFHSFGELILYPWSGSFDSVGGADLAAFKDWGDQMAASNGYRNQQSSDLYISTGDTCDWAYEAAGVFCFTFELSPSGRMSGGFYPGPKMVERAVNQNYESILLLAERSIDPYQKIQ